MWRTGCVTGIEDIYNCLLLDIREVFYAHNVFYFIRGLSWLVWIASVCVCGLALDWRTFVYVSDFHRNIIKISQSLV